MAVPTTKRMARPQKKIAAAAQSNVAMSQDFSSCNSAANSSMRFWAVRNAVSAMRRTEARTPPDSSFPSIARLFAGHQHADEQPYTEGDAEGLIGVFADQFVRSLGACDGLLFDFVKTDLRPFKAG